MSKNSIMVDKITDTKNTGNTNTTSDSTNQVIKQLPKISKINSTPEQNQNNSNNNNNPKSSSAEKTEENGDPVNMATGEYIYEDKDFIIPDMGGDYSLIRRYTGPKQQQPRKSMGIKHRRKCKGRRKLCHSYHAKRQNSGCCGQAFL